MKLLFTLLFSVMLLCSANSQNKQETLNWLNNHKKDIREINANGYSSEDFKIEMTNDYIDVVTKNGGKKYKLKMYWSEIKKTMLGLIREEKGYVTLYTNEEASSGSTITIYLTDFSTEMRERLTLMANLSGTDVMMQTLDLRGKSPFSLQK